MEFWLATFGFRDRKGETQNQILFVAPLTPRQGRNSGNGAGLSHWVLSIIQTVSPVRKDLVYVL